MASDELDGVVFGVGVDDASRYGSLRVSPGGRLVEFAEKRPGKGLVNAGIYLLKRRVLEAFPAEVVLSMETDIFPELLENGCRIRVVSLGSCDFLDIGTPGSVHLASDFITGHATLFS
jgi:D-glycero-alpha-D-manno-heptose 1-phosphate guanylyltransferase